MCRGGAWVPAAGHTGGRDPNHRSTPMIRDLSIDVSPSEPTPNRLSPGTPADGCGWSPGPEDFAAFLPGEVLVARATAPAWTPLFAKAAAVVTDAGMLGDPLRRPVDNVRVRGEQVRQLVLERSRVGRVAIYCPQQLSRAGVDVLDERQLCGRAPGSCSVVRSASVRRPMRRCARVPASSRRRACSSTGMSQRPRNQACGQKLTPVLGPHLGISPLSSVPSLPISSVPSFGSCTTTACECCCFSVFATASQDVGIRLRPARYG